jgi:hypothetical protein
MSLWFGQSCQVCKFANSDTRPRPATQEARAERAEMGRKVEALRREAQAEKAALGEELKQQMEVMRAEMQPARAIAPLRLAALQVKFTGLAHILGQL